MQAKPAAKRYVVLGAGAVGCAVGGLLQRAGAEVVLVARGEHLDVLQRSGLVIATPRETFTLPVTACAAPDLAFEPNDVVLLATKSQDSAHLLDAVDVRGRAVVALQNGVANERLLLQRDARTYAAMVYLPASFLVPGQIAIYSAPCPGRLDLGIFPSGSDELCRTVAADLRAANFASEAEPRVMRLKYAKLLSNLGNVLQALSGREAVAAFRDQLVSEAQRVYTAATIHCASPEEMSERTRMVSDDPVAGEPRRGGSSWQSLARGRGLETAYLNGEIVRLGQAHGVATPLNAKLTELAERASREGWSPENLRVEELARALGM